MCRTSCASTWIRSSAAASPRARPTAWAGRRPSPSRAEPMTSAIAVRGLRYRYGRTQALDGATLDVLPASLHALLGRNGAGKSTLIGCLTGLLRAREGSIEILGRAMPREATAALAEVGVAFEVGAFFGELSGRTNVRAFSKLKGLGDAEADAMLERLEIGAEAAARPVSGYSMGMRQRLSLARAFLGR